MRLGLIIIFVEHVFAPSAREIAGAYLVGR